MKWRFSILFHYLAMSTEQPVVAAAPPQSVRPKEKPSSCNPTSVIQGQSSCNNTAYRMRHSKPPSNLKTTSEPNKTDKVNTNLMDRGTQTRKCAKNGLFKPRSQVPPHHERKSFSAAGQQTAPNTRDTTQALEITQYFFEAVSTQMEKWYERKIEEARSQANQKAQEDKVALHEHIRSLEEELMKLRTKLHKES